MLIIMVNVITINQFEAKVKFVGAKSKECKRKNGCSQRKASVLP